MGDGSCPGPRNRDGVGEKLEARTGLRAFGGAPRREFGDGFAGLSAERGRPATLRLERFERSRGNAT
jgi:hypothetical protein